MGIDSNFEDINKFVIPNIYELQYSLPSSLIDIAPAVLNACTNILKQNYKYRRNDNTVKIPKTLLGSKSIICIKEGSTPSLNNANNVISKDFKV